MEAEVLNMKQLFAPKLRFKGFDKEWRQFFMKEVATKITDGTHDTPKQISIGIPYLTAIHVKDGVIDFDNCYYLNKNDHDKIYKRCNPELGDLLLVNIGAGTATCASVTVDYEFSLKNVALIKPNRSIINPDFLSQLQRKNTKKLFLQLTAGGAQPFLSLKELSKLKINTPSLPEQQKIASFLSSIDEKINQLKRKKELLEQYKKGVMQQLFSGKLRFKDENGKVYPEWEMLNGDKLFDSISDKNHNSDLPILAITQDQGAIPRDMINYQMSVKDESIAGYKVVQVGDFIISLRTFQGGIEFSRYKGICSPAYNILRPRSADVYRDFYKYYFKTASYIMQLQKNLEGIRDGKMISYKYFSDIKLPFPHRIEQERIANYFSLLDEKIEIINKQIILTQTFKKGLLQQMFV